MARSWARTTRNWGTSTTSSLQYPWGVNYFALNFTNPTTGPIFKQLYVRQAMQSLMNQTLWIELFNAGYGAPTYGPVPVVPPTDLGHAQGEPQPYPYSPSHAKALLTSHGWKVVPNGVTTCVRPGTAADDCGAGIRRGRAAELPVPLRDRRGVLRQPRSRSSPRAGHRPASSCNLEPKAFGEVISTACDAVRGRQGLPVGHRQLGWWMGLLAGLLPDR